MPFIATNCISRLGKRAMRPAAEVLESALIVGEVVVFEVDDTVALVDSAAQSLREHSPMSGVDRSVPNVVCTEQKEHLCGQLREVIMNVMRLASECVAGWRKITEVGNGQFFDREIVADRIENGFIAVSCKPDSARVLFLACPLNI